MKRAREGSVEPRPVARAPAGRMWHVEGAA
jgi:hypothetical protein